MPAKGMSDAAYLAEVGRRIARYRLNLNLTQAALAIEAGVSAPTVQRLESGRSTQTSNLIRILRALGLLDNLDALVPEPALSPLELVKQRGRTRQRASAPTIAKRATPWSWGDDE